MKFEHLDLARVVEHLGVPGVVGIGVGVFTLAFVYTALRPAYEALDALREREVRAAKRMVRDDQRPNNDRGTEANVESLVRWLPKADEARQELLRLQAFADKHGLQLKSGEYRALPQTELAVLRHQVLVPVKGTYLNVRGFVTQALDELPALALDAATLQRDGVTAKEIEGRLQFSLYTAGS